MNVKIDALTRFRIRNNTKQFLSRYKYHFLVFFMGLSIWYYFCLPNALFRDPLSVVVTDQSNYLLGARIASDGQWRFPEADSIPNRIVQSIVTFEDKRFFNHPGIDFLAIGRAFIYNFKQKKVVSGGSTLSMQVIRLYRKGKNRTVLEKCIELILATRLELRYTKQEILTIYLSHAPFGGNVVGIDAASWKYYYKPTHKLTWAESAALCVLPNSPSLIHPGRNREKLEQKRDFLLRKLYLHNKIDSTTYQVSLLEPLPDKPLQLPNITPHLTERIKLQKNTHTSVYKTTINRSTQEKVIQIVNQHRYHLAQNGIQNAGALVIEVESGNIISYVGNIHSPKKNHQSSVDMITAPRSTGSIIKPLLYAAALDDGLILPNMLFPDIPTYFKGLRPKNFDLSYRGAVPASRALTLSLNIPFARMLSNYGQQKFYEKLKSFGMTTLTQPASHYGLSLVLGGAETTMWDLGNIYRDMAYSLNTFHKSTSTPLKSPPIHFLDNDTVNSNSPIQLSASAIWFTFKAMIQVHRPGIENFWKQFSSSKKIAWKTGTSFGFRDAWAVGITPRYVVVIWVGNADGEGRPELIGAKAAGPILFDVFNILQTEKKWFSPPYDAFERAIICKNSGHTANQSCLATDTVYIPKGIIKAAPCPYCRIHHLDKTSTNRVESNCYPPTDMVHQSFFTLPPMQEWYYQKNHPEYKQLPVFAHSCQENSPEIKNLQILYPSPNSKIFIPKDVDGTKSKAIFEATHREKNAKIYWHIDDRYIGETQFFHEFAMNPTVGHHVLTIVDSEGNYEKVSFEIVEPQ